MDAVSAIRSEIAKKKSEVEALEKALAVLKGGEKAAGKKAPAKRAARKRKPKTAAQKKAISDKLKKVWADRKKAAKAEARAEAAK